MKKTYNKNSSVGEKTPCDIDNFARYHKDVSEFEPINRDEELALAKRIKNGDEQALNDLIQANLRLVVIIASEYEGLGLSSLDLISEGNIGLVKAAKRFDMEKDVKFSFYAGLWIRQQIKRALSNKSRTIRIPVSMVDRIAAIEKKKRHDEQYGVSDEKEKNDQPSERVNRLVKLAKAKLVSIDTQVNDSDKNTLGDVIPDENTQNPLENIVKSGDYDQIRSNLDCLSSREKEVITKRFGLNDNSPSTFIEIAQKMGLTKERVRQIEEYALVKMRRLFYVSNDDNRFSCAT